MPKLENENFYDLNSHQQLKALNTLLAPVLGPINAEPNQEGQNETSGGVWGLSQQLQDLSTTSQPKKKTSVKNAKTLSIEKPINKFAYLEALPFNAEEFQKAFIAFCEDYKALWVNGTVSFTIRNGKLTIYDKRQARRDQHDQSEPKLNPALSNKLLNQSVWETSTPNVTSSVYAMVEVLNNPEVHKNLTYIQKPCTNTARQSLNLFVPSLCMQGLNSHAVMFALDSRPRVLSSHALNDLFVPSLCMQGSNSHAALSRLDSIVKRMFNDTISDSNLSKHSVCQLNQGLAFFKPTKPVKTNIKYISLNF
ncbi:MAG: hypothetical protein WA913_00300, partial [Pricia sp.]